MVTYMYLDLLELSGSYNNGRLTMYGPCQVKVQARCPSCYPANCVKTLKKKEVCLTKDIHLIPNN